MGGRSDIRVRHYLMTWVLLPVTEGRINVAARVIWKGRAAEIEMENVLLRLDNRFVSSYIRREKVEVRFVLSRTPLRVFHQGLQAADKIRPGLLFPPATLEEVPLKPPRGEVSTFYNPSMEHNDCQRDAVCQVRPSLLVLGGLYIPLEGISISSVTFVALYSIAIEYSAQTRLSHSLRM